MLLPNLRAVRKSKGVGTKDLAKQSGLTRQTIYHIENGKRKTRPSTAIALAALLGVSVEDLTGDKALISK